MRIFSIITAVLVMAALYLLVFERDRIVEFAQGREASQADNDIANDEAADANVEEDAKLVSVVAFKSIATEINSAVLVRGQTEAARQVELRAETSGQVISEPLRKGANVEQGQMLCQLDPGTREAALAEALARLPEAQARVPESEARLPEAEARLAEATSRVAEAQINLRAAERLSSEGFASETRVASAEAANESALAAVQSANAGVATAKSGLQSAQAGILAAEAGIAAAKKEIERLSLSAPFGGLLETDTAELGSLLQPGSVCAVIIQLDPIKLVGFIPETEVAKVQVGALAGARLATGEEIAGRVTFLSRSADSKTRTFRVEIQVPNKDLAIRDGQTAEIVISSDGQAAHLLPLSALTLDNDGQIGVRTVDETNTVQFMPVKIVRDTVDGIWVSDLPETVDVIVVGQEYVVEGVQVAVAYQEASK